VPPADRSEATKELANKQGHTLNALWRLYKGHVAPADLARFDPVIVELAKWEQVRYGGFPRAGAGVAKSVGLVRATVRSSMDREVKARVGPLAL
jgi:hypothetical protein